MFRTINYLYPEEKLIILQNQDDKFLHGIPPKPIILVLGNLSSYLGNLSSWFAKTYHPVVETYHPGVWKPIITSSKPVILAL